MYASLKCCSSSYFVLNALLAGLQDQVSSLETEVALVSSDLEETNGIVAYVYLVQRTQDRRIGDVENSTDELDNAIHGCCFS